jgi:MFS family permease
MFTGTMAGFQIPAGRLSERLGTPLVLAAGTALAGVGYCLAPLVGSFPALIAILLIAGLGASTQHPLGSALVARAFAGPRSLGALGTYNFAGDLGKMALPAAASLLLVLMPWRGALALLGALGLVAALAILRLTPRYDAARPAGTAAPTDASVKPARGGFPVLLSIGVIDSATRGGFLTFLPFLLTAKGASLPTIGLALTLVFLGGAFGKLACAWIGARIGVIATVWLTEGFTALGILALLPLPLELALVLLPAIGVALNGTSSVLYGSVPRLVAPEARTRAFSVFYTGTIGSGAIAPIFYGVIGDALGVPFTLVVVALLVLATLPLVLVIRREVTA